MSDIVHGRLDTQLPVISVYSSPCTKVGPKPPPLAAEPNFLPSRQAAVYFGKTSATVQTAAAICLPQDTEMSLRWKCIIISCILFDVVHCAIFIIGISLAESVETRVRFLAVNLSLRAFN